MEKKASLRLQRTLLNIVGLHYGICVLLLVLNGCTIWTLTQLSFNPTTFIGLLILFILNGLGLFLLIRFVRDLYFTALNTIEQMKGESAKVYRRVRSKRESSLTDTINSSAQDPTSE